jgi:Mn-dependent DtxR family transcriptional regulator
MVEHLAQLGLVRCEPDVPLALTRTGHKVALEIIRHRRVLEAELARAQRLSGRFEAGQAGGDEVVQC